MNFIISHRHIKAYFLKLLLLVIFLALPNSNNIFGQIIIKEKIEIKTPCKPNIKKGMNTIASNSHTVKFEMDWDKSNRDGSIRVIYPSNLDYNMTGWINGGSLDLTVDGFVAPVYIMFQFKVNLSAYEPTTVNYRMSVDGNLVVSGSSTLVGRWSSIPYKNVTYFLDEEEDCGSGAPECNGTINPPELKTKQVLVCDLCANPKRRGAFKPIWESLNIPYTVKVCFNRNDSTWNYGVENDEIFYKYQLTNCLVNQQNLYSKLVRDIEGVNSTDIPEEDFCEAYKSFVLQKTYGKGGPRYFISEATSEHEKVHRDDWINMLNSLAPILKNDFSIEKLTCDEIDSYEDALLDAEEYVKDRVKYFRELFQKKWKKKIGKKGTPVRKKYEENTQKRVKHVIEKYITKLENLYPHLMKDNCNNQGE